MKAKILVIMASVAAMGLAATKCRAADPTTPRQGLHGETVLRLGLPTTVTAEDANAEYQMEGQQLPSLAKQLRDGSTTSPTILIAFGSEYQVFDWLLKARVDGGFLSPLGAYLLCRQAVSPSGPKDLLPSGPPRESEYTIFAQRPAGSLSGTPLLMRSVQRQSTGTWDHSPDPLADYDAFLEDLWDEVEANPVNARPAPQSKRFVVFPSHLSVSGFAAPIAKGSLFLAGKVKHANVSAAVSKALSRRFWAVFFERAYFVLSSAPPSGYGELSEIARARPLIRAIEFRGDDDQWKEQEGWQRYSSVNGNVVKAAVTTAPAAKYFVIKSSLVRNIKTPAGYERLVNPFDPDTFDAASFEAVRGSLAGGDELEPWTLSFKVPELMRLIRQDQQTSKVKKLALVLPGGGVKACYQSTILDHLYSEHHLVNVGASRSPTLQALDVDCVCGTSGGALLGSFVASLKADDKRTLTDSLWFPNGRPLDSLQIFSLVDLPRWFTVIACCLVFCFLLFCATGLKLIRTQASQTSADCRPRLAYSLFWALFLGLVPIGFKYVNGMYGVEHVQALAGIVYFLCVCIALYGDSCFVMLAAPAADQKPRRKLSGRTLVLIVAGIVLVGAPVVAEYFASQEQVRDVPRWGGMPTGAACFCVGVLMLPIATVAYMIDHRERFQTTSKREFLCGLAVLLSVPLLSYLVVYGLFCLNRTSLFELSVSFWQTLGMAATVASIALITLGGLGDNPGPLRRELRNVLDYFGAVHPAKTLNLPRLPRLLMFGFAGWAWWNFVVAPGVYGNGTASDYLASRMKAFYGAESDDAWRVRTAELQSALVVPATALVTDQERYFLLCPSREGFFDDAVLRIGHDPRWLTTPDSGAMKLNQLMSFVLASGSPFPIFSAHWMNYDDLFQKKVAHEKEFLVDGGFAHNVPIEAAKIVGARQVLVVASTPPDSPPGITGSSPNRSISSQLVSNLPRLFPFLFKRSQTADDQSREGLFVAVLEPSPDDNWPNLVDFRGDVVVQMKEAALADIPRRVGKIQNWGPPQFWVLDLKS